MIRMTAPFRTFGRRIALPAILASVLAAPAQAASLPKDPVLIDGFEKIVFGTEIPGFFGSGRYVKKFTGTVRVHIENTAAKDRTQAVRSFVASLDRQIKGLDTTDAKDARSANFVVHVVDRKDYQRIGRKIYRSPFMDVPGSCIVRSSFGREGITRSDALIVSDEGEKLFKRCLVEEVLQGLGPLDDNPDAPESVFNDTSVLIGFSRYDRIMLNMLYDARLSPGMDAATARPLLPEIAASARRRVR